MLKTALTAALALAALAPVAESNPLAGGDGLAASKWASVKVISCSRANRSAVFYGRMQILERGQRMRMRFTLLERGLDGRFEPVEAPALKRWRRSKPGVKTFGYRQRVRGLSADSAYRARVEYRWHDEQGKLVRRVTRRSGVCSQSGPLPNLRARVVGSSPPEAPGPRRYTVRVANAGRAIAEGVDVRFAVDGAGSETKTVARLLPGTAAFVSFQAAPCLTGVTTDADAGDALRESNESDNSQRLACADVPR